MCAKIIFMKKLTSLIFFVSILIFANCTSLKKGTKESIRRQASSANRLDNSVIPTNYDLTLWTDTSAETFKGKVKIDLTLLQNQNHILIHGKDLAVSYVVLRRGNKVYKGFFRGINEDGMARLSFKQDLDKGNYQLEMDYVGNYQSDLTGLYRVKDGENDYLYTQFEPLLARKMLPCFDEPRFKTPYKVSVVTDSINTVITNGPLSETVKLGDQTIHTFKKTKPLPTYLLALAVGPFDVVSGPMLKNNKYRREDIEFRGIATKGKGHELKLALSETPIILQKLEEYFGVAYPFQKLDILAVPDFRAGAMENAGAITFREWYLLMEEKSASVDQKRGFYLVMAHELAHMWFGNLVTMPWWDDLWLNEAFATWLSYKIIDDLKPEFKSSERLLGRSHRAMGQDSLKAARKIREPIVSSHDILNAFDGITYSKGGAVLSMLENFLGPQKFRNAVSDHMRRFKYQNATSKDFLESLAKYSDDSLVKSADTFLNQTGVPTIHLSYGCYEKGFKVFVKQRRYVPIGSKVSVERSWEVPMCIGYEHKGILKKKCFTLNQSKNFFDIHEGHCPAFVLPNFNGRGYYRFSLKNSDWQTLLSAPSHMFKESDRIAIADSLLAGLRSGELSFGFVAEKLRDMIDIRSAMLSNYFMRLIEEASNFWVNGQNHRQMVEYGHEIFRTIYRGLVKSEHLSPDQQILRRDIARFLANIIKDEKARMELSVVGEGYLHRVLKDPQASIETDENLISDALAISLQHRDDQYLRRVIELLVNQNDTVMRRHLLKGVALSREGNKAELIRTLVFDKRLRKNEQLRLFYTHLENPKNQPSTWEFLKRNFVRIKSLLADSKMANLPYLAEGLCDHESAKQVASFFAPFIDKHLGGPRNLAEVIEGIDICAATKTHTQVLANRFFDEMRKTQVASQE